jgi:class 3 adenylate cyclase/tetratricopeptide (TPR) repeat protein
LPTPLSYTPRHLAEKILTSRSALEGERKQVTVLFADVKGSMDLAEQVDPEEWHKIMDRFFAILSEGVHRFEGTVNQYTGDGVMALFGAPIAHEDHAQRACYAALAIRDELAAFSAELRRTLGLNFSTRMGLNSGEVVVGRIGDDLRMDYTAQGRTVGLASRMEALADPGKIYLTEMTGSLVAGFFELKDLGRLSIKGEDRNLRVYELRGAGRLRTRFDVARERGFSPFVGRDTEMGLLEDRLAAALSGQGHAIGVVSEAGMGKSRLCWEFSERCRSRGITVLEARGVRQGRTTSLLPILELFRAYFGLCEDDEPGTAREKVALKLLLLDERLHDALPRIVEFLRMGEDRVSAPRGDPEARRRELSRLLADLVCLRSARDPLAIVGEDLQWWDAASERMIESLIESAAKSRTLFLLNWRPEHRPDVRETAGYHEIVLGPLASEATRSLVVQILGAHPSVASLVEPIVERSEGNPFFVEEVIRAMAASGQLKGEEGDYRAVRAIDQVVLPATVQAVIGARIDALSERDKIVLRAAAVLGKEFSAEVLERVAGLPAHEVEKALESLAEGGLIVHLRADEDGWQAIALSIVRLFERIVSGEYRSEDLYAFRHSLLHEVAYRSQLVQHRSRLHAEVAHTLEGLNPEHAEERASLIGHHLESAGDLLAAARWYVRAARWEGSENPAEALRWWQKVRLLLGEIGDTSEELLTLSVTSGVQVLNLSWRLGIAGDEAIAIFEETRSAAERIGRPEALAGVFATFGVVRGMAGHVRESLQYLREATKLVADSENVGLRVAIAGARAYAEAVSGELAAALATADEALELGGGDLELGARLGMMRPVLFLIALRGFVLKHAGRLGEAREALERALAVSDEERDSGVVGWIHGWKVQLAVVDGADECAMEDARRSSDIAERNGLQFSQVVALSCLGRAHLLREECADAASALEKALALARKRRTALETEPEIVANLAQAVLVCGDPEKAVRLAEEAVEIARSRGARLGEVIAVRILGSVLAGAGRRRAARRSLERALALAQEIGARSVEPFAHLERAELARLADDEAARARELREAHRLFTEIGAPIRAAEAAKELGL